jgi:hypothetical protein
MSKISFRLLIKTYNIKEIRLNKAGYHKKTGRKEI